MFLGAAAALAETAKTGVSTALQKQQQQQQQLQQHAAPVGKVKFSSSNSGRSYVKFKGGPCTVLTYLAVFPGIYSTQMITAKKYLLADL